MKRITTILTLVVLLVAGSATAQVSSRIKITLQNGSMWDRDINELLIQDKMLIFEDGQVKIPVEEIAEVEFRFKKINLEKCAQIFQEGRLDDLDKLLAENLAPVLSYSYLPTNLDGFLFWQLKARFWSGKYDAARETAGKIVSEKCIAEAKMYDVVALIETGEMKKAEAEFSKLNNPENISPVMDKYIRMRLEYDRGNYHEALLHISQIIAQHGQDLEWLPFATVYEGKIYFKTEQFEAAKSVAEELILGYPNTRWSDAGQKLKEDIKD